MQYVKQKDTGEIYPVNEHLLKRGDMIPCDINGNTEDQSEEPTLVVEPPKPTRARRAKAAPVVEEPQVVEEASEVDLSDIDELLGED